MVDLARTREGPCGTEKEAEDLAGSGEERRGDASGKLTEAAAQMATV